MYSDMSEMPGPDVDVNERAPAQPAPSTMPIDAISSSAWMIATFFFFVTGSTRRSSQKSMKDSQSEDDGVIGIPRAHGRAAEDAAERRGHVPLDDDLPLRRVHALDAEGDLRGQVLRRVFEAEPARR